MKKNLIYYSNVIKNYIYQNYKLNLKEPVKGCLEFPFLVPGAKDYSTSLWDWDSWLMNLGLFEIGDKTIEKYQKGCVLNFLSKMDKKGRMPIMILEQSGASFMFGDDYKSNIHKPCLAQHALAISNFYNDVEWIRKDFNKVLKFIEYYNNYQKDEESGLYYWLDDLAIGFDNDPSVFYRPNNSTAAIYLNSLMYSELMAVAELAGLLKEKDIADKYSKKANDLKTAIQNECFDNVDGFFYSADVSLRKIDSKVVLHSGHPRTWKTTPIKFTTWAGMLPLWNKIATPEQAKRVVQRYSMKDSLDSDNGVRSIAKFEKMYGVYATRNPSCWLGPVWINACYFTYIGLRNYGYNKLANKLAKNVITMLGKDIDKCGEMHEYYNPETGEGVMNQGFQNWNFLVLKFIKDLSL